MDIQISHDIWERLFEYIDYIYTMLIQDVAYCRPGVTN